MKPRLEKLFRLLLIGIFLLACNYAGPVAVTATGQETPTNLFPSLSTPTTASSTPTSQAPTQTSDPNAKIFKFNNISIMMPSLLASTAKFNVVPAITANKNQPWLIAPQYVLIKPGGYTAPKGSYLTPEIFIYPAQDYASINSGANVSLKRLQTILANPSAPLTNDVVPWLPYTPGEQSIAAQPKIIAFKSGNGLRMLTQYDIFLDPIVTAPGDPIINRLLFYHFEGLTTDGKTYIVAVLPLEIAFLANDPDPNAPVPPGGVPYPGLGTDTTHYDYFKAVTDQLNAASADSFHPSLNEIDALMASLEISP